MQTKGMLRRRGRPGGGWREVGIKAGAWNDCLNSMPSRLPGSCTGGREEIVMVGPYVSEVELCVLNKLSNWLCIQTEFV